MTTTKPPIIIDGRDIQSAYVIAVHEVQTLSEAVAAELMAQDEDGDLLLSVDAYHAVLAYIENHIDDWLEGLVEEACNDRPTVRRIYAEKERRTRQDANIPQADGGLS